MGLPQANLVLFFLSAFVGLWGVSVVFRGSRARRMPGTRRCPECREDMLTTAGRRCPACGFEAETEVALQRRQRDFRVVLVGVVAVTAGVGLAPAAWWVRGWETTGYAGRLGTHPLHAVFWGVVAFGLVLAAWSWRGDRSRGRRRCPRCWYDMRATLAGGDGRAAPGPLICPECGHEPGHERALYRPRRRWRMAWLGLGLVLVGLYGQTVPRALQTGPVGLVPTTVLIGGMRWLPESWYLDQWRVNAATLAERLRMHECWSWQRDWAGWVMRSNVRRGVLRIRPAVTSALADPESLEDRAAIIVGLTKLLGNPRTTLTSSEADELHDSLGGYTIWWEPPGQAGLHQAVYDAITDNAEQLLQRARTGSDSEAALCLALLRNGEVPGGDWVSTLELLLREGGSRTQLGACWLLGEAAETDGLALEAIWRLLGEGGPPGRLAARSLRIALASSNSKAALLPRLFDEMGKSQDPDAVAALAEVLAEQYRETEEFRRFATEPGLSPHALRGFADAWASDGRVVVGEVSSILLPGLRSDDDDTVHSILFFFVMHVDDSTLPGGELVELVLPLLRHADPLVSQTARELLGFLATAQPLLADQIRAGIRDVDRDEPAEHEASEPAQQDPG